MKRRQLFEFCDQRWLKGLAREAYMDCMNMVHMVFNPYRRTVTSLALIASRTGATSIIDFCSGGAQHIAAILEEALRLNINLPPITLTDLYPQIETYRKLQDIYGSDKIQFIASPVSLTDAGAFLQPDQLCMVSTALHHFQETDAALIVHHAVMRGAGIVILEFTRRSWWDMLQMCFAPAIFIFAPFTAQRFHPLKFLITTLLPVIPLMFAFDGIVSCLRTYTRQELASMTDGKPIQWTHQRTIAFPLVSYLSAAWKR